MKKLFALLLAACLLLSVSALAEEETTELPEEAMAFENVWVAGDYHIHAYTEGEGFVLEVTSLDLDGKAYIWEYKAVYDTEEKALHSVVALKWDATFEDGEFVEGEHSLYDDGEATFALNEAGKLIWKDLKENAGDGLEFEAIGPYEGIWPGVNASAEILWADDHYTVYVSVQNDEGKTESYAYNAFYMPETGTLEASGTCDVVTYVNNEETAREEITDNVEATLSINENYCLVWENRMPGGVAEAVFDNPNFEDPNSQG